MLTIPEAHPILLKTLVGASLLLFILTPIIIPILLVLLPSDAFTRTKRSRQKSLPHQFLHLILLVLKNVFGVLLIFLGLFLLVLPGQGLLTLFVGLMLTNLPGKKALLRRVLSVQGVQKAVQQLRSRHGKAPLEGLEGSA